MFPTLPHRTRLCRCLCTHQAWTERFLVAPSTMGSIDSCGIESIHPFRAGRSATQTGRKGLSHHRWLVGGKLCLRRDHPGQVVVWACDTAHVHDTQFHPLITPYEGQTLVLGDGGCHRARGDASHFKLCRRGEWNERMQVETVLSMLTGMCGMKPVRHRVWAYFRAHLACLMAAFHILVPWHGLEPDEHGRVHLSIAQFTL